MQFPPEWVVSIHNAKDAWNDVVPSQFQFVRQIGSNNTVRYEEPINKTAIAVAAPFLSSGFMTSSYIKINPLKDFDTNNTPLPNNPGSNGESTFNIQNVITHESGHWVILGDITDPNCSHVTMWGGIAPGEIKKISLEIEDKNGLNWQYP